MKKLAFFVGLMSVLIVGCSLADSTDVPSEPSQTYEITSTQTDKPKIPTHMTALELLEMSNKDYDNQKITVGGYISKADVEKKELSLWCNDVGTYSFTFETFPDIDPLNNYFVIEGTCSYKYKTMIHFSDCSLVSQEIKAPSVVYWADGSHKIHFGQKCGSVYVIMPDEWRYGSLEDALASGCTETCHDCIKTEKTEPEPINLEVYWTPNGTKIHTMKSCPALANSDTIYEGTVSEAKSAGRTDYCDRCT